MIYGSIGDFKKIYFKYTYCKTESAENEDIDMFSLGIIMRKQCWISEQERISLTYNEPEDKSTVGWVKDRSSSLDSASPDWLSIKLLCQSRITAYCT